MAKGVVGAEVEFRGLSRPRPVGARLPVFTVTAREEARFAAAVFPAGTRSSRIARELTARRTPLAGVRGTARANRIGRVEPVQRLRRPGRYVIAVRLAAWANPERVALRVSRPFQVVAVHRRGR